MSLDERLREFTAPDEAAAAERGRAVAAAAFAERRPAPRRRPLRALAMAAAAATALVAALTPPGDAVADWVRDLVRADRPTPQRAPELAALPAPGRLLVSGPGGVWVTRADGSSRRLGDYEDATWSPRGLFVGVTRDRALSAVEPGDGTVRWTLGRRERLSQPAWAPSGYRVAYRAGRSLRVVAGDGSGDRLLARAAGPAAPVWRPGTRHVLAYAATDGSIVVTDSDRRRPLWRAGRGAAPTSLVWVPRSLVVLRGRTLEIRASNGRVRRTVVLPGRAVGAAARPGRTDLAVSVAGADGTGRVLLVSIRGRARERTLYASPGAVGAPAFSPDGSHVLVPRPGAGEWVFLPVERGDARAVAAVPRRFDPRAGRAARMPRVSGWTH